MTSTNTNYASTYVAYPNLPKIHSKPTFDDLKQLRNQITANIASVASHLGEGGHSHLGLALSGMRHALVTNVAYVRPGHTGANPPTGATPHITIMLRDEWKR